MLHEANYTEIMAHFNQFRFIAAKPRQNNNAAAASAGSLQEYTSFTQMFKRQYVRFLKSTKGDSPSEMHNVLAQFDKVRSSIEIKSQAAQGAADQCILSAPGFLELLMQANREYLLQFNISEEIAQYLHIELERVGPASDIPAKLSTVLMYNLDKERLEEALRKKLVVRLLDNPRFDTEKERAFSDALRAYFGGKFNHRLELLLDSRSEVDKTVSSSPKLSVATVPATAWPQSFPSPLKAQVIDKQLLKLAPSFLAGYKAKFENRKVDILAWFGTVELVLDRRHSLVVNTGLATCLLMVEERKLSNNDLAESMGGLTPQLMRQLVQPLLDSKLLTEESGVYSIEAQDQIEPAKLPLARMTSATYTELVAAATNVSVTLDKDQPGRNNETADNQNASGALLQYSHPKHKHRVMAFIAKTVKRQPTTVVTIVELAIQNFAGKGLDLVEVNITKNITELE